MKPPVLPFLVLSTSLLSIAMSTSAASEAVPVTLHPEAAARLKDRVRAALVRSLAEEQAWIRVHAAEALVTIGEGAMVREVYERELPALEMGPTRVGAWRVLATTARTSQDKAKFVEKIGGALLTPGAADRLQALESLCKLRAPITGAVLAEASRMNDGPEPERPLACWALHLSGDAMAVSRLAAMLTAADPVVRLRAAYALRWIGPTDAAILKALAAAADAEKADSLAHPYVLSAALALNVAPSRADAWDVSAATILKQGSAGARYELSQTVANRPALRTAVDVDSLERATGDERIGAALFVWKLAAGPAARP